MPRSPGPPRSQTWIPPLLALLLAACPSSRGSGEDPIQIDGTLQVTPSGGFTSVGEQGRSFSPSSYEFTLKNTGTTSMPYSVGVDQPWVAVSQSAGMLVGSAQARLRVDIDPVVAATLAVGSYGATVTIRDDANDEEYTRAVTLRVTASGLELTPSGDFLSSGLQGGPFSPPEIRYVALNVGSAPIDWSVAVDVPWILISPVTGRLGAGASASLVVTVDPTVAGGLPVGSHTGTLTLTDLTHTQAYPRGVKLNVDPSTGSDLRVDPVVGLTASGEEGGPFSPTTKDYLLTNAGPLPLNWSASTDQPWIELSGSGGTLQPSASTTLTVDLEPSIVNALSLGAHVGNVTVRDDTVGVVFEREVSLRVNAQASGSQARSLTQYGITWSFDRSYPVGQFANGDWWVVGPVTIVGITPVSEDVGGRTAHGSMVNPSPRNGQAQGYDERMYAQYRVAGDYDPSLNVARGVSASNPLTLAAGSSLVSSISEEDPDQRPQLRTAAILTVLAAPAAQGAFRPPYSGSDKTIRFNESQLDGSLLQRLTVPPSAGTITSFAEAERMFERPWLDHVPRWIGIYIHPSENMPDYGRDIADEVGVASMLLHLDFPLTQKRTLVIRFVQLGIDLNGVARDGGEENWRSSAGHMSGRKWPILFAGLMLGDRAMFNIGFDPAVRFGEDGQTFLVQETPPGSGIYNNGYGGYTSAEAGVADWGTNHETQPWFDDADWFGDPYRLCCTANAWWGQLLAAHVMGVTHLWVHDPLFQYQDRFLTENRARGVVDWRLAWRPWYLALWDEYRDDY